jgi:hypothetical protein
MDQAKVTEILELLEQVSMKMSLLRKTIGPEKNVEESPECMMDYALEESHRYCKNMMNEIESAFELDAEEA